MHCEVIAAEDAAQALALLRKADADLLFTDVVMPGMTGLELADEARKLWPDLPVLLASGYSEDLIGDYREQYELVGKPYDMTSLTVAMARAMRDADSTEAGDAVS
jgi:CheY-like chemotaxis protein